MLALSCLGSFLAMPVFYLLYSKNWVNHIALWTEQQELWVVRERKLELLQEFYVQSLPVTCGVIACAGALIVGLFGFRHVFSKKMVDQFHSIPVKRRDLFLAQYLNGFNIWLVPMLIGAISCAILSTFFVGDFVDWMVYVVKPLGLVICNLVITFLLIYHVVIVAVMMSGNILNTLVNGTIINFAVILLYCMMEAFCGMYFDTYYSFFEQNINNMFWTSPICSAIFQLYMYAAEEMLVFPVIMNILMILVLFAVGFGLYLVRPSELSEQGMKIKWVQVLFKSISTVLAGLAGWGIFYLLTESLAWQIFGTILAGVLCYGILDIIFHMDFKAFFAHKLQLGGTVLATILIGLTFFFDWTGYDAYMPKKENIEEIGIYVNGMGMNNNSSWQYDMSIENRINRMSYRDKEVIYKLLAELTGRESQYLGTGYSQTLYVRVTERNGKTYYRQYRIRKSHEEIIVPILCDESYVRSNVLIPQALIDDVRVTPETKGNIEIEAFAQYWYPDSEAFVKELMMAYNEDILENPELFIYQEDEVFADMYYRNSSYRTYIRIDFYESMERVKAVFEKYDYKKVLNPIEVEDVKQISMHVYLDKYKNESLKNAFGLEEEEKEVVSKADTSMVEHVLVEEVTETYEAEVYNAIFTEKQDIEEILGLVSFRSPNYRSIFRDAYSNAEIRIELKNGETFYVQMKTGIFPEKFLEYFDVISYQ
jgi:hypothetical protein